MPTAEQPPDPDEFGTIPSNQPPQEQEPQEKQEAPGPTPIPLEDFLRNVSSIDFSTFRLPESNERPGDAPTFLPGHLGNPYMSLDHEHMRKSMEAMRRLLRERRTEFSSSIDYFGFLNSISPTPKPEAEPVEKPDPYPSRAGWRAEFLLPHDPAGEEPKDKPKGKIGEYEIIESVTTLEDVGGNARAKDLLTEIAAQFEDPDHYVKWDVPVPKGVLLYGKPGTGKTMLAKAFANQANAAFVEIPVATLRDKYYGVSEKNLQRLFDEAAKYKGQVVLFFDEIDSLLLDRSEIASGGPDAKLVNTFLQAMDGMRSATNVMVLGATNYPDRLDAAATRPGRFDQKVEVELPDKAGCREIAAKQLLSAERKAGRALAEDILNLDVVSQYLEGLSGAHIAEVLNRVKRTMAQTERAMQKKKGLPKGIAFSGGDRSALKITTDDIVGVALNYRITGSL